jgi:hypothetical protein
METCCCKCRKYHGLDLSSLLTRPTTLKMFLSPMKPSKRLWLHMDKATATSLTSSQLTNHNYSRDSKLHLQICSRAYALCAGHGKTLVLLHIIFTGIWSCVDSILLDISDVTCANRSSALMIWGRGEDLMGCGRINNIVYIARSLYKRRLNGDGISRDQPLFKDNDNYNNTFAWRYLRAIFSFHRF